MIWFVLFKDISGKKVQTDFEGGEVSSDAGLLFLREVERQSGAIGRIAEVLQDHHHSRYTTHLPKAEHNHRGLNTLFIFANLEYSHRRYIYQKVYSDRGNMELYI